jgi:mono/diheme cytochrome c family protein
VVRRAGAIWLLFSTLASAQAAAPARGQALSPFAAAKARALMRERLPCAGCHTFDAGGGGRIGPDLSGVAERRPPEYVRRMIEDPQGTVPGTVMPRVPMPVATRELIVAYLTRMAPAPENGRVQRGADAPRGETAGRANAPRTAPALYARHCAACHGVRGGGDGPNARHLGVRPAPHADRAYMSRRSDDRLFDAIYAGGYPLGRGVAMPPYGQTLTRTEIWALVRYLRELCRCSGPGWSTDADRAPTGSRR